MGIIRVVLALAVVFAHDRALSHYGPVSGPVAVEMFFIISGFYMALVLSTTYDPTSRSGIALFYVSRFLRLWPVYALVASATLVYQFAVPLLTGNPGGSAFMAPLQSTAARVWMAVSQTTMIGLDTLNWFHADQSGAVHLTIGPVDMGNGWQPLGAGTLVGQAWSIGTEIWFYLLAPFLVRRSTALLIALAVASLTLRAAMLDLGFAVYFFFPAQLALFLAGVLAYRWREALRVEGLGGGAALALLFVGMALYHVVAPRIPAANWILYVLFAALIPSIFAGFAKNRLDRDIGELSYPIYITHLFVLGALTGLFGKVANGPAPSGLYLAVVLAASYALYLFVDKPMDHLRHSLTKQPWVRRRPRTAAGLGTAE